MRQLPSVLFVLAALFSAASARAQENVSYVTFRIASLPPAGSNMWMATYADPRGTAKFIISMPIDADAEQDPKGFLRHVDGSKPQPFLERLTHALGATRIERVLAVQQLDLEFAVLGTHEQRLPNRGGFAREPPGNWILIKLFLADDAEVYLNLNPVEGIGELSAKDETYGDTVVRELASVL